MRLLSLSLGLLPLSLAAYQQPLQVYLHPSPPNAHKSHGSAPTLSADQAKAILTHHLGGTIGDFEEIPNDEGLWGHLVNMWNGNEGGLEGAKARVVFIDGGVSPQGRCRVHCLSLSCPARVRNTLFGLY